MTLMLKPKRGGFLRPFGCGWFIREFLLGNGPYGSPRIDPDVGAPQADIFREYKMALMRATALDKATRAEEKQAKREKRPIDPDNIEKLAERYLARMPYKAQGARFHSFVIYFNRSEAGLGQGYGEGRAFGFPRTLPRRSASQIFPSHPGWARGKRG